MRAFILRRVELIAHGLGDVVLVGSRHSAGTLRVQEFLTRNGHPYAYVDLDRDAGVQALLDRFHVTAADVPVLICRGDVVLRNPDQPEIADCLGFNEAIDQSKVRDLVDRRRRAVRPGGGGVRRVGGPRRAGRGVDVAGRPGRLELARSRTTWAFPTGISGQELAARALHAGAEVRRAGDDRERRHPAVVRPEAVRHRDRRRSAGAGAHRHHRDGRRVSPARARQPGAVRGRRASTTARPSSRRSCAAAKRSSSSAAGTPRARRRCSSRRPRRRVHVLVRSDGLAESMSRYLIRRIEESPAHRRCGRDTEIVALEGDGHLERVRWRRQTDRRGRDARHPARLRHDRRGAATRVARAAVSRSTPTASSRPDPTCRRKTWRPRSGRSPGRRYLLETSLPGVFAVGDVRGGSMKRVASAVGEGSTAVAFVHRVLKE